METCQRRLQRKVAREDLDRVAHLPSSTGWICCLLWMLLWTSQRPWHGFLPTMPSTSSRVDAEGCSKDGDDAAQGEEEKVEAERDAKKGACPRGAREEVVLFKTSEPTCLE